MWFDNYVTVWKQKREHFNSLPLDEFKKGNFFTKDEIKKSCTTYLQEVLSLEFLPTFCPSNEVAKKKSLEKKALLTSPQQSLAFDSLPQHILSSLPEHILSHGFKNLDLDSRSSVDCIFEKKTKKEELVVAYERMLNKILIMNPLTLPEIRINLLKNLDDRTSFLFRAQEEKREDALHPFFSKLELSSDDTAYLRESLENATIDFEEMRKQDSRFDKLISLISLPK